MRHRRVFWNTSVLPGNASKGRHRRAMIADVVRNWEREWKARLQASPGAIRPASQLSPRARAQQPPARGEAEDRASAFWRVAISSSFLREACATWYRGLMRNQQRRLALSRRTFPNSYDFVIATLPALKESSPLIAVAPLKRRIESASHPCVAHPRCSDRYLPSPTTQRWRSSPPRGGARSRSEAEFLSSPASFPQRNRA